jgi:DnaK suppressor protein
MGKSDSRIRVKAPATKGNHKAALNGSASARHPAEVKKHQTLGQSKPTAKPLAKPVRKSRARESNIILPEGYRPSENEPFMNERQKIYFRNKLVAWKEEIIRQNRETLHILHEDSAQHADLADRATSETDRALELRARDRQRKLINKIDAALARIEEGSYGFCEETGEPIGLKRLDARPIATLSLEAQERHERREKVFRED